uniref:Uncharacterized protein n=1 Tax=Picea glauca TaxID=3330 RepID=A0A117NFI8_PICGL|nr:hypothetical protein ABT39_MTgene3393 [Picea glauca]KUM45466.1 hypothetical protein ABT39_MTgene2568 [Picea glauca]KUM45467.1 hypothetical protein ABT39_MTgene2569 [Picea glauca]QHR88998.1 hypothetical protein Q903MT_gene3017 [Picea sitchensis]
MLITICSFLLNEREFPEIHPNQSMLVKPIIMLVKSPCVLSGFRDRNYVIHLDCFML